MNSKSMIDVAYEILATKKNAVVFAKLYDQVANKLLFDEAKRKAKISQFYTDLSLDKRFTRLKDNKWQLSSKIKFAERYIEINDFSLDDDSEYLIQDEDNKKMYYSKLEDEDDEIINHSKINKHLETEQDL